MKADRLLSALLLLQARGLVTGRELAERLEVSVRTVHRDMEALSAAGVPVFALRGARGGWKLDEEWRTRVPGLDQAELGALLMAAPGALGDTALARDAERAMTKLLASLPTPLRAQAAALQQRLHVDVTAWWGSPEKLSMLPLVQQAVASDRKLALRYRPPGGDRVERRVDPLGLVAKGTSWYLVAGTPKGLRSYRVSRIERARLLDIPCERPEGFDLARYWNASTESWRSSRPRYWATLRVTAEALRRRRAWRWTASGKEPRSAPARAWLRRRFHFDDEDEACSAALGFGASAEVLAPRSLRQRVRAEIRRMAASLG